MASAQTQTPVTDDNPTFTLVRPHEVEYRTAPVPELTDPHSVIVRVKYTGICGSDVHYWQHGRIGDFVVEKPMVLGHESSGLIHAVGSAVTHLSPGDPVALEPGIPCRLCPRCKEGRYNLCSAVRFAATPPIDGTLCRFYALPADFCYKLPAHVSLQEGALIEPLAVAVHIAKLGSIGPGDAVVVYGAGPVGLLVMAVARAFGARTVVAVDVNPTRLDFARGYAATHTFTPDPAEAPAAGAARLVAAVPALAEQGGADVAVDASGAEVCIQAAVHVCRRGARYVQGGMGKADVVFPLMAAMAKELEMRVSFRYKEGDYRMAVGLVSDGRVDVRKCVTEVVAFGEAERAFGETKAAKGIKVLIRGPE